MDLSGFLETISTREKIFPERSRTAGSVSGKSIIVPRIGPLGQGASLAASYHQSAAKRKGTAHWHREIRPPPRDNIQLQKRSISDRMQQTAEATASRLRWSDSPDCR
jgi:hypothetical protein